MELELKQNIREKILSFEEMMRGLPTVMHGDCCPLKHTFAHNVYVREIFIPKDMVLVGKIHKHTHPNFLMSGEVSVVTENNGVERLKAPLSMISPAGTKRVVYAHEDTVWITVHVTDKTDIDEIEEEVIVKSYNEIEDNSDDIKELIEERGIL